MKNNNKKLHSKEIEPAENASPSKSLHGFFSKKKKPCKIFEKPAIYLISGSLVFALAVCGGALIIPKITTFGLPFSCAMLALLGVMSLASVLLSMGLGIICSKMDEEKYASLTQ